MDANGGDSSGQLAPRSRSERDTTNSSNDADNDSEHYQRTRDAAARLSAAFERRALVDLRTLSNNPQNIDLRYSALRDRATDVTLSSASPSGQAPLQLRSTSNSYSSNAAMRNSMTFFPSVHPYMTNNTHQMGIMHMPSRGQAFNFGGYPSHHSSSLPNASHNFGGYPSYQSSSLSNISQDFMGYPSHQLSSLSNSSHNFMRYPSHQLSSLSNTSTHMLLDAEHPTEAEDSRSAARMIIQMTSPTVSSTGMRAAAADSFLSSQQSRNNSGIYYDSLLRTSSNSNFAQRLSLAGFNSETLQDPSSRGLNSSELSTFHFSYPRQPFASSGVTQASSFAGGGYSSASQVSRDRDVLLLADESRADEKIERTGTNIPSRLTIPSDSEFLDPVHVFLRRYCIEVFVTTKEDMEVGGRGARPSMLGQVGLRCTFCKDAPKDELARQSICFPSKRGTIFESVRNFSRTHMPSCTFFPEALKAQYDRLSTQGHLRKRSQKYTNAYYTIAASELGIIDTPNGLAIGHPPNESGIPSRELGMLLLAADNPSFAPSFWSAYSSSTPPKSGVDKLVQMRKFDLLASERTRQVIANARREPTEFVFTSDFPTVSDFEFLLFHQIGPCTRPVKSSDEHNMQGEDDVLGFCCRHCSDSSGMYLQISLSKLSDTSFLQRMLKHVMKCDAVQEEVKDAFDELKRLADEYETTTKRGLRKRFVEKIWQRMKRFYMGKRQSEGRR